MARWPFWARVALGAVLVPATLLSSVGCLWLLALVLRPLVGAGGPLEDHQLAMTGVLWLAVVAVLAVLVVRRAPDATPAAGPEAPGAGRARPVRPWTRGATVLVGALSALVLVWPFTAAPGDSRWVGAFDAPYNAWLGWRLGEAFRSGTLVPLTVPDALWPAGVDLLVTDGLLPAYLTGLGNVAGLGPYAAYDLTLLIGVGLSIWAGSRLGAVLTDRPWVALAGGVAFAAAPVIAAPVQAHVAFVWAFALPLLVRRAVLDARSDGPPRPWPLAGLLVLAFACSAYHLVFGGLAYLLVAVAWPGSALRRAWWPTTQRLLAALAVAVVVLSPFLVARLRFEGDERAAGGEASARVADAMLLSADGLAALVPPDELRVDPPAPDVSVGPVAFASLRIATPGIALLAGGGIALVLARRGAAALCGAAGVLWLLSLGPALRLGGTYAIDGTLVGSTAWLPFRLLLEVPGLGNLRAPYRASFAVAALLAAASVLALDAIVERLDRVDAPGRWPGGPAGPRVLVAVTVVVAIGLGTLGPLPTSDLALTEGQRAGLEEVARRGRPGEAVVLVPFGCRLDDPRVVALQIVHHQPSLGCSTSRAATPWASGLGAWTASDGLRALWCGEPAVGRVLGEPTDVAPLDAESLDELQTDLGVRFVVVEGAGVVPAACPWLAPSLEVLGDRAEVLADDGGWLVLDLGPPSPSERPG